LLFLSAQNFQVLHKSVAGACPEGGEAYAGRHYSRALFACFSGVFFKIKIQKVEYIYLSSIYLLK
jgi:hypothetical protein